MFTGPSTRSRSRWALAWSIVLLLIRFAGPAHAAFPCTTPLFGFGPIDPVHGFPQYYQDSTGLALQPCLDAVCAGPGGFVLPNPALPLSFPGNFPDEFFYHRAIASMNGPNGETFILVLGLTGSFSNGVPADGPLPVNCHASTASNARPPPRMKNRRRQ